MHLKVAAATVMLLLGLSELAEAAIPLIFLATGNPADGRPFVEGATNLPDGTDLGITITRQANSYIAQAHVTVQGGKFKSPPFSDKGNPLNPGKYVLTVVAPITMVQPAAAREALGDNYSKFSGPLIRRGNMGSVMRYEAPLLIPGQTSSAADLRARQQAANDKVAWMQNFCRELPATVLKFSGQNMTELQKGAEIKKCLADVK